MRVSGASGGPDISDAMMSENSRSAVMDHSNRRRWLISAAIVLLIHVCIAGAVLTWRHMNAPPILVDLTPAPSVSRQSATLPGPEQPSPQQTTPQQNTQSASSPASASAPVDNHAGPPPPSEPTAPNESTANAEPNTGPARASAGVNTHWNELRRAWSARE
jgi:cytoskeletal protein RodZ